MPGGGITMRRMLKDVGSWLLCAIIGTIIGLTARSIANAKRKEEATAQKAKVVSWRKDLNKTPYNPNKSGRKRR